MIRLLLSVVISATSWFEFLDWAWGETEGQIDKMQDAAFDTPGVESPVPPAVLMAALSVVAGHFAIGPAPAHAALAEHAQSGPGRHGRGGVALSSDARFLSDRVFTTDDTEGAEASHR